MKIIGVTGISGSGKTQVASILAEMGGFVVDADQMAHGIMKKGQKAYNEILEAFGQGILETNGEISRPQLGKVVFHDKEKLAKLESIIHPKVIAKATQLINQNIGKYRFAVIDAPLLIEAGMHNMCHSTWLITASNETRLERIIARDNITKEAAVRRLQSRQGDEALKPYANVIIENNDNTIASLEAQVTSNLSCFFG